MIRKNLFDYMLEKDSLQKDIERINKMYKKEYLINEGINDYTLWEYINFFCFDFWKNRGHFLDLSDLEKTIGYADLYKLAATNEESLILFIEFVYNIWTIAQVTVAQREETKVYNTFFHLQAIMDDILEQINHKAVYYEEDEKILLVEDKPEVTAVAEISTKPLAREIIRYNHHSLKGNLEAKRNALLAIAHFYDTKKPELDSINKALSTCIFRALNNLNIRHDNCKPGTNNYRELVAKLSQEQLEQKYDDLYQLLLLGILEMDNVERKASMKEFLDNIEEKQTI